MYKQYRIRVQCTMLMQYVHITQSKIDQSNHVIQNACHVQVASTREWLLPAKYEKDPANAAIESHMISL